MNRIAVPCLMALLSLVCNAAFAQKAVLVKLSSEKNRITHFESRGDKANAEYVRKDAAAAIDATIGDFEANFHFCDVYYFIDTNLDKVLASKLEGVLLDENLRPAANTVLKNGDTGFLIVYYGIPDDVEVDKKEGAVYKSVWYPNMGLVVLGHDYKRIKGLDHFIYRNSPFRKSAKQHVFTSKKFSIEYKPRARELEENIQDYQDVVKRKSSR